MRAIQWQSIVDFIVLAGAVYLLLRWAKQARAVRIALGIIGLHAGALLARSYDLAITSWVLSAAGFLAVAVLLVVFQPELRHAFMRLDTMLRAGWQQSAVLTPTYAAVAEAAFELGRAYIGALIVIVRRDSISELIQGGIGLGANVSRDLLETIFQKSSPMHDGAVIVDGSLITRAEAVLPLTQRTDVPAQYGTRHRAAMGLAERCDALAIAVSEQRGTVTLMRDSKIQEMPNAEFMAKLLERLQSDPELTWFDRIRLAATRNLQTKLAALAIAAGIWAIALFTAGTTVRMINVPIAFTGVPAGMNITAQSAANVVVQLRGNALIMDSVSLNRLVATVNVVRNAPGSQMLHIGPANFDLPPGIRLERASPSVVSVRLAQRAR